MKKSALMALLMLFMAFSAIAQVTQMKGVVVSDDDGLPVVGATVKVTGTNNQTVTNIDGEFQLKGLTTANQTITVSFVGMATQIVAIAPEVTVVMVNVDTTLEEVIVVAFGKQKRESFTGSASVVTSAEIERQQVTNPIEALSGNVTGMQMIESNSFTSNPQINIRGIGSIMASTSPLIVLDGLPYNGYWNDINPNDVASITVLKDAASNALYGARGANGVILITTKQAQRGNTKVTLDAKWGVNTDASIEYDYIKNPGQHYEAHYQLLHNYYMNAQGMNPYDAYVSANNMLAGSYSSGGLGYMVYSVPQGQYLIGANGKLNPNATIGNRVAYNNSIYTLAPDNWTKNGLRDGFRQEYNINLSGGNNQFSFLGSMGYLKDEGLAYGNDLERITTRLKADYQAYSFLRLGTSAGYTHTETNSNSGVFSSRYSVAPVYPLFVRDGEGRIRTDEHGNVYDYGAGNNAGMLRPCDPNGNMIQDDLLDVSKNSSNAFNIQGYANLDFLKHFRFTANGSVYITENRMNYATNPYYGWNVNTGGYVEVDHYRTTDTNFQQLLNYNNSLGLHNVDVLLGHEYSRNSQTKLMASRNKVAMFTENIELPGAIIDASMDSYMTHYNVEGFFFRGQYDYDNKYFGSVSFRRDGSSRFHPDHRWGTFWSLGGAWIMSKEGWFNAASTPFNMFKVKASYGEQGNDGIGNFRYTDLYTINNVDGEIAYVFSSKGNPNITWETVGSFNAGVEFAMFNSRLNFDGEFYVRTTRDMLMWLSVPYSLGYTGYYDNIGDMRNTGVEIAVNGDIIATRNIGWNVGLNFTWERNRVSKLPAERKTYTCDGHQGYPNGNLFYGEGLPVRTWYLKQYAGVSTDGQAQYWATDSEGNRYATTRYDDADYHVCGSALPDVYGGFNTSLRVYGFDFTAQFNYSIGGKKYDSNYQSLMTPPVSGLTGGAYHMDVFKAWSLENPNSNIPRWQYNDEYASATSDRWLTDASYLTFKNFTIGYTLPKALTERLKMSKVRVYFTGDNIYYWAKRQGFDPRMGTLYGNYNSSSYYAFPRRSFSGGLQIQF